MRQINSPAIRIPQSQFFAHHLCSLLALIIATWTTLQKIICANFYVSPWPTLIYLDPAGYQIMYEL